jgi:hypothetical protein
MLKYWFKILKTENCMLKNCYEYMFESSAFKPNDKLNWGCKIRDILCKYGFNRTDNNCVSLKADGLIQ